MEISLGWKNVVLIKTFINSIQTDSTVRICSVYLQYNTMNVTNTSEFLYEECDSCCAVVVEEQLSAGVTWSKPHNP